MGVRHAFDQGLADFTGISDDKPLFIGAVFHEAFVSVDEQGTEAAAATAVQMLRDIEVAPDKGPVAFTADHPFLFLIRHRGTGVVLFVGRMSDPTASNA
jgi:serpin B